VVVVDRRGALRLAAALIAAAGLWQAGQAAWIPAKARLAQVLLERAWATTRDRGRPTRPWPWADTWPVARLWIAGAAPVIVLAGTSGRSLAFAPGLLDGSAAPGMPGHSVIAAHRDTHFRGLQRLRIGDELHVERADGHTVVYRVVAMGILDTEREQLVLQDSGDDWLTLVTCYPFDAVRPGGPLRFLVHARRLAPGALAD